MGLRSYIEILPLDMIRGSLRILWDFDKDFGLYPRVSAISVGSYTP